MGDTHPHVPGWWNRRSANAAARWMKVLSALGWGLHDPQQSAPGGAGGHRTVSIHHGQRKQRFFQLSGRCNGRKVPVEPGYTGAEPELQPAATRDVGSTTPRVELWSGRRERKKRGFDPAGAHGLFLRRRPACADKSEFDLPGREGFSQWSWWRPQGGSVLADSVPEGHFDSVACLCHSGSKTCTIYTDTTC